MALQRGTYGKNKHTKYEIVVQFTYMKKYVNRYENGSMDFSFGAHEFKYDSVALVR